MTSNTNNILQPSTIIGFAGGGGVECGLIAAGIKPTLSIEFDPTKPQLSNAIANTHELNFNTPILRETVESWASQNFPGCDNKISYSHFSPVCCNFSQLTNRGDQGEDLTAANAIASFITAKQPQCFTLENVPAYKQSESWGIICRSLLDNGYFPHVKIYNFADHGIPQNRKRLFCVALEDRLFQGLLKEKAIGWGSVMEGLELPKTTLTNPQWQAVQSYKGELPVLIPRIGYRNQFPPVIPCWKPAPTIRRSFFDSGNGGDRSQVWTIWDGKQAYNCSLEFFRRIQTFPDWYQFPEKICVAGSILGNSVPPVFVKKIYHQIKNGTLSA